jgi:alpha-D-ribose 1-methylphosphonate 5-triphosphate synthase subunit PhnH
MSVQYLEGGFADPARQAAHAFRGALQALSRPGRIETLAGATPPAPCSPAAGALLLTLCDGTTGVHLAPSHDTEALRGWITFHTGAPLVAAEAADFALGTWEALDPVDRFAIGTAEYPDRSATLIVEMPALSATGARLTGPGIETEAYLSLPETAAFTANRAQFPLGFDCFFTSGDRVAGLPRSTRVTEG